MEVFKSIISHSTTTQKWAELTQVHNFAKSIVQNNEVVNTIFLEGTNNNNLLCFILCVNCYMGSTPLWRGDISLQLEACTILFNATLTHIQSIDFTKEHSHTFFNLICSLFKGICNCETFLTTRELELCQKASNSWLDTFKVTATSTEDATEKETKGELEPSTPGQSKEVETTPDKQQVTDRVHEILSQFGSIQGSPSQDITGVQPKISVKDLVCKHTMKLCINLNASQTILHRISILSMLQSVQSLRKESKPLAIIGDEDKLKHFYYESCAFSHLVTIKELFANCTNDELKLLINTCDTCLHGYIDCCTHLNIKSDTTNNATITESDVPDPAMLDATNKNLICKLLAACCISISDRISSILHSRKDSWIVTNFRALQTLYLLEGLQTNLNLNDELLTSDSKTYIFSVRTAELGYCALTSLSKLLKSLKDSPASELSLKIPETINLFEQYTNTQLVFTILFRIPCLSILISIIFNAYTKCLVLQAAKLVSSSQKIHNSDETIIQFNDSSLNLDDIQSSYLTPISKDHISTPPANLKRVKLLMNSVKKSLNFSSEQGKSTGVEDSVKSADKTKKQLPKIEFAFSPLLFQEDYNPETLESLFKEPPIDTTIAIPDPPPDMPIDFEAPPRASTPPKPSLVKYNDLLIHDYNPKSDVMVYFVDLALHSLKILKNGFLTNSLDCITDYIRANIMEFHIKPLALLVCEYDSNKDQQNDYVVPKFSQFYESLIESFHLLFTSGSINNELQLYILENLNFSFDNWPVQFNPALLSILSRCILCQMKKSFPSENELCVRMWFAFLDSLTNLLKIESTEPTPDLNYYYCSLLLFTFSSFSQETKKTIFLKLIQIIHINIDIRDSSKIFSLTTMRILMLFEYFLYYFTHPYDTLLHNVETYILSSQTTFAISDTKHSNAIQKQYNNSLPDFGPVFYDIINIDSIAFSKVDSVSLSILANLTEPISYKELYFDLIRLYFQFDCPIVQKSDPTMTLYSFNLQQKFRILKDCLKVLPFSFAIPMLTLEATQQPFNEEIIYCMYASKMANEICESEECKNYNKNFLALRNFTEDEIKEMLLKYEKKSSIFGEELALIKETLQRLLLTPKGMPNFHILFITFTLLNSIYLSINELEEKEIQLTANKILKEATALAEIEAETTTETEKEQTPSAEENITLEYGATQPSTGNILLPSEQIIQAFLASQSGTDSNEFNILQFQQSESLFDELTIQELSLQQQIAFEEVTALKSSEYLLNENVESSKTDSTGDKSATEPENQPATEESATQTKEDSPLVVLTTELITPLIRLLINQVNSCNDYLFQKSGLVNPTFRKLLDSAIPNNVHKDLTYFNSSLLPNAFDKHLTKPLRSTVDSYLEVKLDSFDKVNPFDSSHFDKIKYSYDSVWQCCSNSLTIKQPFDLSASFKICIRGIINLIKYLLKLNINQIITEDLILELSLLIHHSPLLMITSSCNLTHLIPKASQPICKENASFHYLLNASQLILLPDLIHCEHACQLLNVFYTIIQKTLKDANLLKILCKLLQTDQLNLISTILLPINEEFTTCTTQSLITFCDLVSYQKDSKTEGFITALETHLNTISIFSKEQVLGWFDRCMLGFPGEEDKVIDTRCDKLLELANAISISGTAITPDTCQFILSCILPLGDKILDMIEDFLERVKPGDKVATDRPQYPSTHPIIHSFLPITTGLAEFRNARGELLILEGVASWLPRCKDLVLDYTQNQQNISYEESQLEFAAACNFLSDLLEQIKLITTVVRVMRNRDGTHSGTDPNDAFLHEGDSDYEMEPTTEDEMESLPEETEDDILNNKLCTFTVTQKDYMKQHWYYCHTCKLIENTGVCTICVKVCHKGHEISYAKQSPFFCDCGGEKDGNCQALIKRSKSISKHSVLAEESMDDSILFSPISDTRSSEPIKASEFKSQPDLDPELMKLVESIEQQPGLKEGLYSVLDKADISQHTLSLLVAIVEMNKLALSTNTTSANIKSNIEKIKTQDKTLEYIETLAPFSVGSSEGAFENVKFQYSDDTGSAAKLLISSNMLKRNSLCIMGGTRSGSRQYLLISFDKGRFTTLPLATLLKSDSASKKKLNITRIASALAQFTIISMCANHFEEGFVALCGLRECHVCCLTSSGHPAGESLPVHVGVDSPNYIVKALWLPRSPSLLAIVSDHFIKIFDLTKDTYSPIYYFVMPTSSIKDATYISSSSYLFFVIMTHSGHIYIQEITSDNTAENGMFFMMNVLTIARDELETTDEEIGQSGVSIYFSHALQLLFFSYGQGLNYAGSFNEAFTELQHIFPITLKQVNSSPLPVLCQWVESPNHPGVICAQILSTATPVVMFMHDSTLYLHEFKALPAKAKVQGMVLNVSGKTSSDNRTTLILLCEDGSLKTHVINKDKTLCWLNNEFLHYSPLSNYKSKKVKKKAKSKPVTTHLPLDFVENSTCTEDIEFGGNDVLHVYNQAQVKNRLGSDHQYIVNTKPIGFSIDVLNTNPRNVLVGVRILLGNNSIAQSPSYIEVFERQKQVAFPNNKGRWFDIPFAKEEIQLSDKKVTITFGPSKDPSFISYVDSIKAFCKTKESFGWQSSSSGDKEAAPLTKTASQNGELDETTGECPIRTENELDKVTNLTVTLLSESSLIPPGRKQHAIQLCTQLLTCSLDKPLKQHCKLLLFTLHSSSTAYYLHKDDVICRHIIGKLYLTSKSQMTPELYQQLLLNIHSIAINRPQNISKLRDNNYILKSIEEFISSEAAYSHCKLPGEDNLVSIIQKFIDIFWDLHCNKPAHTCLAPIGCPGLTHVKTTVSLISGVLFGLMLIDSSFIPEAVNYIMAFLKSEYRSIRDFCLNTLCSLLKPKQSTKLVKRVLNAVPISSGGKSPASRRSSFGSQQPTTLQDEPTTVDNRDPEDDGTGGSEGELYDEYDVREEGAQDDEPSLVPLPDEYLMPEELDDNKAEDEPQLQEDPVLGGILDPAQMLAQLGFDPNQDLDDDTIMNLAFAMSLHDQQQEVVALQTSIANNISNLGNVDNNANLLAVVESVQQNIIEPPVPMPIVSEQQLEMKEQLEEQLKAEAQVVKQILSSENPPEDIEQSGEQSSTGTLTPPVSPIGSKSFPTPKKSKSKSSDKKQSEKQKQQRQQSQADNSSDQGGESSGDDGDIISTSQTQLDNASNESLVPAEHIPSTAKEVETDKLHILHVLLLQELDMKMSEIKELGGIRAILFMQLLLTLIANLRFSEHDYKVLVLTIKSCVQLLDMPKTNPSELIIRSGYNEVNLIVIRFLSILMSREKKEKEQHSSSKKSSASQMVWYVTAQILLEDTHCVDYCLKILNELIRTCKTKKKDESRLTSLLLKPIETISAPPDLGPFFLKQYVKGHANDVFEDYPKLLIEVILRLSYQLKKISDSHGKLRKPLFSEEWISSLSEYIISLGQSQGFGRRQVRKLMLYLCGTKEEYRLQRDLHSLISNIKNIRELSAQGGIDVNGKCNLLTLDYEEQINLLNHIIQCADIGLSRPENWQKYCLANADLLQFLMHLGLCAHEDIASNILNLISCASCGADFSTEKGLQIEYKTEGMKTLFNQQALLLQSTSTEDKLPAPGTIKLGKACSPLIQQFFNQQKDSTNLDSKLVQFVTFFLLETNSTSLRIQAQKFLWCMFVHCDDVGKSLIVDLLWTLSGSIMVYGQKAQQFVDLLCLCSEHTTTEQLDATNCVEKAISLLKALNELIISHPNSHVYQMLSDFVELDGFFLESEPCLVCNNPEMAYSTIKLMNIKADNKFTTKSIIVKLANSYTISNIALKISDPKRFKSVRTLIVYYCNKVFQNAVELKNRRELWQRAKECTLYQNQQELKIPFALPIVACNIIIEYTEFFENLQATPETLQCPRCSANVPAHPGHCAACGENVYQCHKCRSINYDEKDPFLCNSCGHSKYGKFEYQLYAKQCASVDPITGEEDRKKTINTITTLLDKADQVYKQLQQHRQTLDLLLTEGVAETGQSVAKTKTEAGPHGINRVIQAIAQRYCGECKSTFNELSKIIQGVLAARQELVRYDSLQSIIGEAAPPTPFVSSSQLAQASEVFSTPPETSVSIGSLMHYSKCYGCASRSSKHCISILRSLASINSVKKKLVELGLLNELCKTNLRIGTSSIQNEVRELIFKLTQENPKATSELNATLISKMSYLLNKHRTHPNLGHAVRHEIQLLKMSMEIDDKSWEDRLKTLMLIFHKSTRKNSPVVLEYVTLPCLKIILQLITFKTPLSQKYKSLAPSEICELGAKGSEISIGLTEWLKSETSVNFLTWKNGELASKPLQLQKDTWLRRMLFHPSCQPARATSCSLFKSLLNVKHRQGPLIDLLTSYLSKVPKVGECAQEYLDMFQNMIIELKLREYLASKDIILYIGQLISDEIINLSKLEETTIKVDISLGYTLKMLSSLLFLLMSPELPQDKQQLKTTTDKSQTEQTTTTSGQAPPAETAPQATPPQQPDLAKLVADDAIFKANKPKLLSFVLDGYLSLKRLVVQRTKRIDDAQERLLELLELMTSGTLEETQEFMAICIDTLAKFSAKDLRTPVIIFEELCSIISPEESENLDFFLSLEKDPQQEEFLQGRMQNNPYIASDDSIGPLMRDVKNKICRDTELLPLLEDDTGMDILVCNKIINLDLAVKEVYQKVWLPAHPNGSSIMRVVYRMRGLLGEATEDMVDSLVQGDDEVDEEEKYKVASVMCKCGGLDAVLFRLVCITNAKHSISLLTVALKLLSYCVKLQINRKYLLKSSLNTLSILLNLLTKCLASEEEKSGSIGNDNIDTLLSVLHIVLQQASATKFVRLDSRQKVEEKVEGDTNQLKSLFGHIASPYVQQNTEVLKGIMHLIPFLTYGDVNSMQIILEYFSPYLDFEKYDKCYSSDQTLYLECFCNILAGISIDDTGATLKNILVDSGPVILSAIKYIAEYTPDVPCVKTSNEWIKFLDKQSLPYIFRILAGICINHPKSQKLICDIIPQLHATEDTTLKKGIGLLAENVLNNLKDNEEVFAQVQKVRDESKKERKRKAIAFQEKELAALNKVDLSTFEDVETLKQETGLVCCICMEGYNNHPRKILGIYTFSKACVLDEFENKPRRTPGYSTVSGFNIVHLDCHNTAIRTSRQCRGKEEWEAASGHNSNVKCNSIMPVWGPEVQDNGFYSCLAKHHTCVQDATGCSEPNFWSSVHDIKLLLARFSAEKSFSDECGGGSKLSNIQFLCYQISYSFYLLSSSRTFPKEHKTLSTFLEESPENWVPLSFELDGTFFHLVGSFFLLSDQEWKDMKVAFLRRVVVTAHARLLFNNAIPMITSNEPLEYSAYKPYLIMFGMCNKIQTILKKNIKSSGEKLANEIVELFRHDDKSVIVQFQKLASFYHDEILPCESFPEYCDVMELLDLVTAPDTFITETLNLIPKPPSS